MSVPIAHAEEPSKPSVEALISSVASEVGVSSTTLYNLAKSESTLNPDAVGDHGCSLGLTQINTCAHNVSKEDALDPEFNLTWTAKQIKADNEDMYTSCNCYGFIQANYVHNLPRMAQIVPNTTVPHKGEVAIFWLHEKGTGKLVKHIAYLVDEAGNYAEANRTHCKTGSGNIHSNPTGLIGYWDSKVQ